MPITTCTRCAKLYIERSGDAANEPGRLCPTCFKGGAAAYGLAALCAPIVEGYAAGKSGLDGDMLQHLVDLGDQAPAVQAQEGRLQRLEAAAIALVQRLEALGFGDEDAAISGADAIDAINEQFPSLREVLAP
jgi:hypothetical protein